MHFKRVKKSVPYQKLEILLLKMSRGIRAPGSISDVATPIRQKSYSSGFDRKDSYSLFCVPTSNFRRNLYANMCVKILKPTWCTGKLQLLPVAGRSDLLQRPVQAASLQQGKSWPETGQKKKEMSEREIVWDKFCQRR